MSTTSTKSDRKKSAAPAPATARNKAQVVATAPHQISELGWRISAGTILFVAALVRFFQLSLVPFHHDEGVNGNFLVELVRQGNYHYNPENYHGPTLYYFSAVIPWLTRFFGGKAFGEAYGLNDYTVRGVTALFGVATICLVLMLRKRLGTVGALSAAALIAISPGAVYLSRYFIHEPLFVFFTLGIVVMALKYYDTARPVYLTLTALFAGLMTATKETWIMNGPVLLIALVTTALYFALAELIAGKSKRKSNRPTLTEQLSEGVERFGGPIPLATVALVALTVFILVNVFFYSSFFTNYPKGVSDALKTLNLWRARTREHAHPFLQYFEWLRQEESPLLLLGGVSAALALWRRDNRFAVFAAQWAFGLIVAYSLVEYKTPWISLNFIVPLAIASGYAMEQLYRRSAEPWLPLGITIGAIALLSFDRLIKPALFGDALPPALTGNLDPAKNWPVFLAIFLLAAYAGYIPFSKSHRKRNPAHIYVVAAVLIACCGYQMYQLNFVNYDDDRYPYVYAHTKRELLPMVSEIDQIATRMKTGSETGIAILSPEYWPLPWYFRNYKRVGYYQQIVPTTEPVIIGSVVNAEELESKFGKDYQKFDSKSSADGSYALRPGVDLLMYVRKDVAK